MHTTAHVALILVAEHSWDREKSPNFILAANGKKPGRIVKAKCRVACLAAQEHPIPASNNGKKRYIVFYEPASDLNQYLVSKYILKQSIF